ncbi:hypothetical protein [Asaia sp. As-1742]|uniref:hypothetical protein n=1 Tax=Asaia sp. As-1742 TaxID=2608325 RepID=UPI00141FDC9F|nr:hypothetical protein [Asaia sp. As-1742]NIE80402.1 hypothetical protein [Asaia sp. As-1742]
MVSSTKIITFISEGHPYDAGYDLTASARILQEHARNVGASFSAYSPSILRKLGVGELIREYPDEVGLHNNPFLHKVGFAAWKPFIILHAMQSMKEGDVILYVDGNVLKYHSLINYVINCKELVSVCLGDRDFYIGREHEGDLIRSIDYAKYNQIYDIALNSSLANHHQMLIVNNIIARVNDVSRQFFLNWLALCMQERYIHPPTTPDELHPAYRWFCPEQSILNMLVVRYILERRLSPEFPGISCGRDGTPRVADNSYVHAAGDIVKPEIPFEQQFEPEIQEAQRLLSRVFSSALPHEDWNFLHCTFDDWTSHEDDASTELEPNGDLIFIDGTEQRHHLIRYRNRNLDHAVVMLNVKIKFLEDETRFLVNQWGGYDICTLSSSMEIFKSINCVDLKFFEEDEDGFRAVSIVFLNYHDSISIGSIKINGTDPGDGKPIFVFRDLSVAYRRFSKF